MSSSCLSRSANSLAKRRNWRATACATLLKLRGVLFAAHVVSRVRLHGGRSSGLAAKCRNPQCVPGALAWPARTRLKAQLTSNQHRTVTGTPQAAPSRPVQWPADVHASHLRCLGLRLWHDGSAHRGVAGETSWGMVWLPSHGVMDCQTSSH